jgi:putative hydrolase
MTSDLGSGDPSDLPFGDALGDVPLFREIQRVLLSSSGPINWELARQVGIAMATWGTDDPMPTAEDAQGLAETVRAAELAVAEFTGLSGPPDVPKVEAFRRAQWVEANCRSLRDVLDPVATKLTAALSESSGPLGLTGGAIPGLGAALPAGEGSEEQTAELMQAIMGQMAPLLLGAQVGSVLGYLGQRVLGQFDLAVPRSSGVLYFVVPNIAAIERDWSLPPMDFRAWVSLHEVTHRFEFAQGWVRDHFVGLVRDLMEHAEIDLPGLQLRLEEMDLSSPEALSQAFESAGNLFGEASNPEQRLRVARVQAFMAAAEGYGDHVMEAVGGRMLASFPRIEEAMARYREGRHGDQALERLLGLEMKAEQYRLGRAFCAKVAEQTDEATLARMWESADNLPSMPELEEPTLWLSRIV